ncbi:trypsin-like cysteine/serine peptidase domain-containing protein [Microdochium trichocladiopsis]|uniref:Trypsin-like cysteine/serine peptidase domain-containing protein n=1 Tax=Microdochium trichocladiopsis TaxID=1682393 RepID=A0A9P8Y869_9PEZI|nr:trypsin-like cysteine/serine peptidase domain-containing protein [Microdochium trichocladiopsis]KAH7030569.1 trypsin-like cysteine/serine peptidase domain-containing protein [Microdochium trichocladiopsis]
MALTLPSPDISVVAEREDRIVGGVPAWTGDFPFIVAISDRGSQYCGGVLINAYTVLTAAHCSIRMKEPWALVRAGSLYWASGGVEANVSEIYYHPEFNFETTDNDIALWRLASPIHQSSTIRYAPLPLKGWDPVVGSLVTAAGWGHLDGGDDSESSPMLRRVTVPVISRGTCRADYAAQNLTVTNNMWCAGLKQGGKDSCGGDSGGPIVDALTKTLLGIVSWGTGCAEPNQPGVYVRISNYIDYIHQHKWTS